MSARLSSPASFASTIKRLGLHALAGAAVILPGAGETTYAAAATVQFTGKVDQAVEAQIEARLAAGDTLEIDSTGGFGPAFIKLADFFRKNSISIVIPHYCFSGCASTLFPAGRKSELLPGAILGFHNTISSMRRLAASHGLNAVAAEFAPFASHEEALYREEGISPQWLIDTHLAVDPKCFAFAGNSVAAATFFVPSSVDLFVPTDGELKSVGYRYTGHLPRDRPEVEAAQAMLKQTTGREYKIIYSAATRNYLSTRRRVSSLEMLKTCQR